MARANPQSLTADLELNRATADYAQALSCRNGLMRAAVQFQAAKSQASPEAAFSADEEINSVFATLTLKPAQAQPAWY